jgi:hypothetical protein
MTATPAGLADLVPTLDAYRTCELVTVTSSGTPIAWPTVFEYRPDDGTFVITTSIALPQKALNVRRDPRVALLLSDPTGSGLTTPPQVLVQGTATCPADIVTGVGRQARYWTRLWEHQPSSRMYLANAMSRRYFDWYYMRLIITVTPADVRLRPGLSAPAALTAPPAPRRHADMDAYDHAIGRLPAFRSAVLAAHDPEGRPTLLRVRPVARPADRAFAIEVPAGVGLREGRASLLCHSHDDKLDKLRSFVVAGILTHEGDDQWLLTPDRYIPGAPSGGPVTLYRAIRDLRAAAARYLDRRGLARPAIPWTEYQDLRSKDRNSAIR